MLYSITLVRVQSRNPNPHHKTTKTKQKQKKKDVSKMAMEYIKKSRSNEHGTAELPLYDPNTDKVVNRISTVDNSSCLKFLSDKRKSGYSDISGVTCKMVMSVTRKDDNGNEYIDTGESVCEILRVKGNDVIVSIDGVAYTVYIGVTKFYKI